FRLYEWRWTVTWRREFGRIAAANAAFALLFAAGLYLSFRDVPRLLFAYYAPLAFLIVLANHLIVRTVTAALPQQRTAVRIAIVGTGRIAGVLADRIAQRSRTWPPTKVVGFISTGAAPGPDGPLQFPILGRIDDLAGLI